MMDSWLRGLGYDLLNDDDKQKVYNRLSVVMNEIFGKE